MPRTNQPKVVVIGGGTGSFALLSGLKKYTSHLTALVNMADDGGSTGALRDELGVLPPGDVRQCLAALSEAPQELRDLFNFRFAEGKLAGHSFGNLFLSALEKTTGDFSQAVKVASDLLRIRGRVLPITTTDTRLTLELNNRKAVHGEAVIAHMDLAKYRKPELKLEPAARINPEARQAIMEAALVVIAPGNLYGSLAPALLVAGVGRALKQTKAAVAYVCNLVTKPGQTDGFSAADYAAEIERFTGAPVINYLLYNTAQPPEKLIKKYMHDGEYLVSYNTEQLAGKHYRAVGLPLIAKEPVVPVQADALAQRRSLIRHDGEAVAKNLLEIMKIG